MYGTSTMAAAMAAQGWGPEHRQRHAFEAFLHALVVDGVCRRLLDGASRSRDVVWAAPPTKTFVITAQPKAL